ncbi:MAG: methyltransferase domain-containing protein [bacterium]|nr:methyltransferase domain-containing protein [bacterium]
MTVTADPYSRLQYRRVIAWPGRIRREWPLLEEVLGSGPSKRVLDLGCGTGEHTRFLAEQSFEVVGVDRSPAHIEEARREQPSEKVRFVLGDLTELRELSPEISPESPNEASFGGAICLGNTLPHVTSDEGLRAMAAALRRLLLPGAPLVVQILNYERIFSRNERHLPLNIRPDPDSADGEIVFLRLMQLHDDGFVDFCPTTLRFRPGEETPVEVVSSRKVRLRAWKREQLEGILAQAGFLRRELYGGFDRRPFDPQSARDLILVGC